MNLLRKIHILHKELEKYFPNGETWGGIHVPQETLGGSISPPYVHCRTCWSLNFRGLIVSSRRLPANVDKIKKLAERIVFHYKMTNGVGGWWQGLKI